MSTTSPTSPNTWNFPYGPSSRYHQRERPVAAQHAPSKSAYISKAPVLSTEIRANHRRSHTQKSSISSVSSPPSEYTRSPLSRFSSYHAPIMHRNKSLPATPAKPQRRSSSIHNSPFSDYFTDDARSVDSNVPSTETKQLLVRMNKLQSQLMRDSSSDANCERIKLVATKLDEIERAFSTLHAQMEDSGIFSDEEVGSKNGHHARSGSEPYFDTANGSMELPPEPSTLEEYRAERDWFVLRTQELLEGLRFTQAELSKRFAEARQLNEEHNAQIEERDTQIEQLRSENEGLRSDLGFEYSELLFLKLQMKSLEVDVGIIGEDPDSISASRGTSAKKNRILSEMDRWRSDWQDVKGRFRRRRSRYGVSPERRDSLSVDGEAPEGQAEWHLQTVKEGHGRVTSLTIKRMDSTFAVDTEETSGTADKADALRIKSNGESPIAFALAAQEQAKVPNTDLSSHRDTSRSSRSNQQTIHPSSPSSSPSYHKYVEHGTQTEHHHHHYYYPPLSQDEEDDGEDRLFSLEQHQQNGYEYPKKERAGEEEDCAITTSSEASDVEDVQQEAFTRPAAKTAWQELWESLQNLTGIDDRFED